MKAKLDLSGNVYNENDLPIGTLAEGLIGSFNRLRTNDESLMDKIEVFINDMKQNSSVELDEADEKVFRKLLMESDAPFILKSPVRKKLDKLKFK